MDSNQRYVLPYCLESVAVKWLERFHWGFGRLPHRSKKRYVPREAAATSSARGCPHREGSKVRIPSAPPSLHVTEG